jgi:hypothetical protein
MDLDHAKRQFLSGAIDRQTYRAMVQGGARGIAAPAPRRKPTAAPAGFWDYVATKQASGMTRAAAVRHAVVEHGAAHEAWLSSMGAR